ncbi:MAG: winged helix-turn-helix transcriptional regulator [Rhodothermia bacterium]|nr:MAG: winged helix-turn-helix transcriptional regulator [Rhodothermia bacterium]
MNNREREESVTLEILEAIEARSDVTQRHLARSTGIALGLANSYLKRCVRKGLVKIHQAPANRYLYYLTPKGFTEKSRLTARYLSVSFAFYRKAGDSCGDAFKRCRKHGWNRVVLCGVSDLAEIASLRALEHDIEIAGIYDPRHARERFLNREVVATMDVCEPFDVCLLTDLNDPQATYADIVDQVSIEGVVVPNILGLTTNS